MAAMFTAVIIACLGLAQKGEASTMVFKDGFETTLDSVGTGAIYAGTQDTWIVGTQPQLGYGNNNSIYLYDNYITGLLRFDDIFGSGPGQIAIGSTVTSALLTLTYVGNAQHNPMNIGEVFSDQAWDESTATWNSVLGGDGVTFGTDTTLLSVVPYQAFPAGADSRVYIDVTSSLNAWSADPTLNNGWGMTLNESGAAPWGNNHRNVQFYTSESQATFAIPTLTLTFVPEPSSTALLGLGGLALMLRRRR